MREGTRDQDFSAVYEFLQSAVSRDGKQVA